MNEKNEVQENLRRKSQKTTLPFMVALISSLSAIVSLLLPYMAAVGDLAKYIEDNPNRIEIQSLQITASDLARVPIIFVSNLITGVYGKDSGTIANVIVLVFGGFLVLTTLFIILKRPIAVIIFNLLAYGTFFLLSALMKDDFIAADTYAWGIGYYTMTIAIAAIFAGAVWMLITKIIMKRQAKKAMVTNSIE